MSSELGDGMDSVTTAAEVIEVHHEVETVFFDNNIEHDELSVGLDSHSDLDSEHSDNIADVIHTETTTLLLDKCKTSTVEQSASDEEIGLTSSVIESEFNIGCAQDDDVNSSSEDESKSSSNDEESNTTGNHTLKSNNDKSDKASVGGEEQCTLPDVEIENNVYDKEASLPSTDSNSLNKVDYDNVHKTLIKTIDEGKIKDKISDGIKINDTNVITNEDITDSEIEEDLQSDTDDEQDDNKSSSVNKDTSSNIVSTSNDPNEMEVDDDHINTKTEKNKQNTKTIDLKTVGDNMTVENDKESNDLDSTNELLVKPSRELKLLLELSKEANLNTNIGHKRKSMDPGKASEDSDGRITPRARRSQNPEFVAKHQKFLSKVVGGEESKSDKHDDSESTNVTKRKRNSSVHEKTTPGAADDTRSRKMFKPNRTFIKSDKDAFCWRCHKDNVTISCETCPRSFHGRCLKHHIVSDPDHWPCPECVSIWKAESTKTRPASMKDMTLEHLCGLLKFALKRMNQIPDSTPFQQPVNEKDFADYKKYIVQPMDLTKMDKNIKANLYGSPNAFEADSKWILHNSIIFNSYQSKLTSTAKSIVKVCKQEMSEIENCSNCYLNANTKKDWFVEVCPKPHILLWAKLKGFPYWPAKSMCCNQLNMVDVRFFGAHDRAWVSFKDCYLYSEQNPNSHQSKKNDINECIKEVNIYIENLKKVYGEFRHAPFRTNFDPTLESKYLLTFLPKYKPSKGQDTMLKKLSKSTLSLDKSFLNSSSDKSMLTDDFGNDSEEKESKSTAKHLEIEDADEDSSREMDSSRASIHHVTGDDDCLEAASTDYVDPPPTPFHLLNKSASSTPKKRDLAENIQLKVTRRSSNINNKNDGTVSALVINREQNQAISDIKSDKNTGIIRADDTKIVLRSKTKISDKLIKKLTDSVLEDNVPIHDMSSNEENKSECKSQNETKCIKEDLKINKEFDKRQKDSIESVQKESNAIEEAVEEQKEIKKQDMIDEKVENKEDVGKVDDKKDENINDEKTRQEDKIDDKNEEAVIDKITDKIIDEIQVREIDKITDKLVDTIEENVGSKIDESVADKEDGKVKDKIIENKEPEDNINKGETNLLKVVLDDNNEEPTKLFRVAKGKDKCYQNKKLNQIIEKQKEPDKGQTVIDVKEEVEETNKEEKTKESVEYEENDLLDVLYTEKIDGPKTTETINSNPEVIKRNENLNKFEVPKKGEKAFLKKIDKKLSEQKKRVTEDIIKKLKEPGAKLDKASKTEAMFILNRDYRGKDRAEYKKNAQKINKIISNKSISDSPKSQTTIQEKKIIEPTNKKRKLSIDSKENNSPLRKKNLSSDVGESSKNNYVSISSILAKETKSSTQDKDLDSSILMEIKSEPPSTEEDEISENEYMEAKLKLLSALNISEKRPVDPHAAKKANEIRTRSKTEEKNNKNFKIVDNLTQCIDNVALDRDDVGYKKTKKGITKQRARKTFTNSKLNTVQIKQIQMNTKRVKESTNIPPSTIGEKINPPTSIVPSSTQPPNLMFFTQSQPMVNSLVGMPNNQLTYTPGNQFLTMLPNSTNAYANFYLQTSNQNLIPTANVPLNSVIPTQNDQIPDVVEIQNSSDNLENLNGLIDSIAKPRTPLHKLSQKQLAIQKIVATQKPMPVTMVQKSGFQQMQNGLQATNSTALARALSSPSRPQNLIPITESSTIQGDSIINMDDFGLLQGILPNTVAKAMSELICQVPPRLKPRPPGPLSTHFDEGTPSIAGPVTANINSMAHRLTDYFRGMLIETLTDVGRADNTEATITHLKLENESLKHKHNEEILEIKKNVNTILKDIQKSILEEKEKIIQETRASCDIESIKRVEEAKLKQWCANCLKEAQFYCCWNTSYCDYPCQTKHWPKHMPKCTQNGGQNQQGPSSAGKSTPIVLRQTAPPKGVTKAILAKSTKVIVNRANSNKLPMNLVRATSSNNHITLVESTPGNYELVGNGPISIDNRSNITKLMSNPTILNKIKSGGIITVTAPNSTSAANTNNKSFTLQGQTTPKQSTGNVETIE